MKVLEADPESRKKSDEPSGAAESLRNRTLPKMGDRACVESEDVKKLKERKEQRYVTVISFNS